MTSQTATPAQPGEIPSQEEIDAAVRETLSQPEFRQDDFVEWWTYLIDVLKEIVRDLSEWAEAHPVLKWISVAVLSAITIILIGHIVYSIVQALPARRGAPRFSLSDRSVWKILEGKARNWDQALGLARDALGRGDLYQAIWIAHRLLLALLDQKGLLQFQKWKTNGEYLSECRRGGEGAALLDSLSRAYDKTVYAHEPSSGSRISDLLDRLDEFKKSVVGFTH